MSVALRDPRPLTYYMQAARRCVHDSNVPASCTSRTTGRGIFARKHVRGSSFVWRPPGVRGVGVAPSVDLEPLDVPGPSVDRQTYLTYETLENVDFAYVGIFLFHNLLDTWVYKRSSEILPLRL